MPRNERTTDLLVQRCIRERQRWIIQVQRWVPKSQRCIRGSHRCIRNMQRWVYWMHRCIRKSQRCIPGISTMDTKESTVHSKESSMSTKESTMHTKESSMHTKESTVGPSYASVTLSNALLGRNGPALGQFVSATRPKGAGPGTQGPGTNEPDRAAVTRSSPCGQMPGPAEGGRGMIEPISGASTRPALGLGYKPGCCSGCGSRVVFANIFLPAAVGKKIFANGARQVVFAPGPERTQKGRPAGL